MPTALHTSKRGLHAGTPRFLGLFNPLYLYWFISPDLLYPEAILTSSEPNKTRSGSDHETISFVGPKHIRDCFITFSLEVPTRWWLYTLILTIPL